jgi:protein-S-isoprenylcysteine O-methyltransferase Ste14
MHQYLPLIILIQTAATWYMTGLICFVQLVHYPLMNRVADDRWIEFESQHMKRTTLAVAPGMLVEAFTCLGALAIILFATPTSTTPSATTLAHSLPAHATLALLLALIWLSTWTLQVPAHNKLAKGFDQRAHTKLVTTNWIRTIAWSLRAIILTLMVSSLLTTNPALTTSS